MVVSATAKKKKSKLATHLSQPTVSLQDSTPLKKLRQNVEAAI
jgi:hypothetical protein